MTADQVERRLAAIFVADVEGYSRLMGMRDVPEVAPFRRPEDVARYAEGLRLAGLGE